MIASLLEGALGNYLQTYNVDHSGSTKLCLKSLKNNKDLVSNKEAWLTKQRINKYSRGLFPFAYLIFIVVYWLQYASK